MARPLNRVVQKMINANPGLKVTILKYCLTLFKLKIEGQTITLTDKLTKKFQN